MVVFQAQMQTVTEESVADRIQVDEIADTLDSDHSTSTLALHTLFTQLKVNPTKAKLNIQLNSIVARLSNHTPLFFQLIGQLSATMTDHLNSRPVLDAPKLAARVY